METCAMTKAPWCAVTATVDVIGGRWKPTILFQLKDKPRRFNELRRLVPGITQPMVTQPLHIIEIAAGHAYEPAALGIVDGMDGADIVDAGMARLEAITLDRLELRLARAVAAVQALVLAHVGVFDRLAVDRPGVAVIVR